jgi:hypothetical protein
VVQQRVQVEFAVFGHGCFLPAAVGRRGRSVARRAPFRATLRRS